LRPETGESRTSVRSTGEGVVEIVDGVPEARLVAEDAHDWLETMLRHALAALGA